MGCSRDLLVGLRLRRTARRLRQRADDRPAREIDFERVVPEALGFAQDQIGGLYKRRLAGGTAAKRRLGPRVAPGLVCDTAERETRLFDDAALELEADRDGYQRERIREPVADLEIGVVPSKPLRRQLDRGHELVRLEVGVALRRVAGKPMKVRY